MAAENRKDTPTFFTKGTLAEWEYVLSIYKDVLKLKASQKIKKPEELVKLDCWYQEELPNLINARKEKHVTHDEIVQIMKWKLSRGKFTPQLTNLVRINTPLAVTRASRKAFKKFPNLATAIQSLTSLKGVGPAMASAVLAAGGPQYAPFMADECLLSMPNVDSIDYTVQEYVTYAKQVQATADRLNEFSKDDEKRIKWNPHKVELALWAHYVACHLDPTLLDDMPTTREGEVNTTAQNGNSDEKVDTKSAGEIENDENSPASIGHIEPVDNKSLEENNQSEDTDDSAPPKEDSEEPESKRAKQE